MILDRRAEKDAVKRKVLSFKDNGLKRKMVIKIEFTPLSDRKTGPFKKGCNTAYHLI